MEETKSYVLILDIPNFRYAVSSTATLVDEKSVRDFLHKFQKAQLQYKYIQSQFIWRSRQQRWINLSQIELPSVIPVSSYAHTVARERRNQFTKFVV